MIRHLALVVVFSHGLVSSAAMPQESLSDAATPATVLLGARAEIDASRFPTLQDAFDAIPPEGGMVRLPPGTFDIMQPLVLSRGDVLIEGAGTATHIRNLNTDGQPALVIRHADGEKVDSADLLWRVMLSQFRITGQEKSGHGIEAIRINEIHLQGVTVSHHGGDGIKLDNCYEDPRVIACLITYNKQTGLNLPGCHDIVVSGNHFEENRDAVRCFDAYNLCMTGNCLDDHLGDGVVIENTYGSVVSGNMIEECDGRAIVLARDCYGITLASNVIAHNGGGIDLVDAHGCAVSANTFPLLKMPPRAKDGAAPLQLATRCLRIGKDSGRITVVGNSFCDSFVGADAVRRRPDDLLAGGIVLEGTRDVNIIGNTFSSVPQAVELREPKSENISFSQNMLIDARSDKVSP